MSLEAIGEMQHSFKDVTEIKELLRTNQDGKPLSTIDNFLIILTNDSEFSNIQYNIMTGQPEKDSSDWSDTDEAEMLYHIENTYNLYSKAKLNSAFLVYLRKKQYSPIQEIIKGIKWDGKPHCENFFIKWAKAPDGTEKERLYSQECARLFFAQGIARAFSPGSKCDYAVVLMGKQGHGKSLLTELLALDKKYYSKLKSISGTEAEKNIQGSWVVELEEMIATSNAASVEDVKQFISSSVDKYRNSYGKYSINHSRTCVFIGTTNRHSFLTDPTGNRRWFPLEYHQDGRYLYEHKNECIEEIKQCWAEMYHYWVTKDNMSSTAPKRELLPIIEAYQRDAEIDDPEIGIIEDFIIKKKKKYVCIAEIWVEALGHKEWELGEKNRNASVDLAAKLTGKLNCTNTGKTKRFGRFGRQKAFEVPSSLFSEKEAYQRAVQEESSGMPF